MIRAALARLRDIAVGIIDDVDAELSAPQPITLRWAVFGGLIFAGFVAALLSLDH